MKKIVHYLRAVAICEAVGVAGGLITTPAVSSWYKTLNKPSINPPSSVFGPVWTTLYALMGISSAIITSSNQKGKNTSLSVFAAQLILNFLWTVLFFGLRSPFGALIEIVFLGISIFVTAVLFWSISKKAALLLVPYLLWVCFASILNFKIWKLNK